MPSFLDDNLMKAGPCLFLLLTMPLLGCTSAPEPQRYLASVSSVSTLPFTAAPRIGLSELTLPTYARGLPMAARADDGRIVLDDDHRWASPPEEMLAHALAQAMESRLHEPVLARPYVRGFSPEYEVRVTLDQLLRRPDGAAELSGQFIVTGGPVIRVERFRFVTTASINTPGGFADAVGSGVQEMAQQIATALPTSTD